MARNTVRLNNPNDVNAIYGNPNVSDGTLVLGADGFQKIVLKSNPLNVTVDNSMERVDFSDFNLAQLTFKPEGTSILVLNGSNTIAQISVNMNDGTQIACKNGGLTISYDNIDNPTAFVLKGADDASAKSLPFGSQDPFSPDSSFNPNNTLIAEEGGGDTPDPVTTYTMDKITDAMIAAGGYVIEDTAAALDPTAAGSYAKLVNAKSVILKDNVERIVMDGDITPAAKDVLSIKNLDTVKMTGAFDKLMSADASLPEALAAKNPAYIVTSEVKGTAPLTNVPVSTVANGDTVIKTFFDKVTFEPTSLKPATAPTLGKYSIKDDATNIKAALADEAQKALLEDTKNCSGITVEDTVEKITDVAMTLAAVKGSIADTEISVKDSLQALSSLTETMRNALTAVDNTVDYVVSDTDKADLKLSDTTLGNLNGLSSLDLSALKTLNISAVAKDETNGLNLSDTTFIGDTFTGKVNFTGSDVKDEIADWKFNADTIELGDGDDIITTISKGEITTIDAGAGNDQITINGATVKVGTIDLGAADDTTGNTLTLTNGTVTTINGGDNKDTITINGGTVDGVITLGDGDDDLTIAKTATVSKATVNAVDGDNTITVEAGKAASGLTVNLGEGNDTVKLNATAAAFTASDNADTAVLINSFGTGDKVEFVGLTGFDNTIGADKIKTTSIQGVLTTKQIYLGDGSNPEANDLATFKKLFTADGSTGIKALAENDEVIMVTKAAADSTKLNLWYVKGVKDDSTATADNDIIVLLGTVDNGTNATLTADNIAHA